MKNTKILETNLFTIIMISNSYISKWSQNRSISLYTKFSQTDSKGQTGALVCRVPVTGEHRGGELGVGIKRQCCWPW